MAKRSFIPFLCFLAILTAGCHSKTHTPNTSPTVQPETTFQTETSPIPDRPAEEETKPGPESYEAYQWMTNVKAEDVAFVEFLYINDPATSYRRYEGEEIQEVIDLFQAKKCLEYMPYHPVYEYAPWVQWPGYFTKEFHVVMKDGTAHTVCAVYSTATVIDGTGFHTISDWLNHHWPEAGNAPLPENWVEEAAARNYHTASDSHTTLTTNNYDIQRQNLDHSYNTDVTFGSISRSYPIGRGGIRELAASGATGDGLTLSACWTGASGITSLHMQPQYWLEAWQEDPAGETGTYVSLNGCPFFSQIPLDFPPETPVSWHISWQNTCGTLPPGHYRVGMIFCEEYNGTIQNETICYAKFSITE